jgi:hypothetical protein
MSSLERKSPALAAACAMLLGTAAAQAAGLSPISGAIGETKPIIDIRARYESVDQVGIVEEADAGTIRARLGVETGKAWNTALLAEGEFITPWLTDYRADPAVPKNTQYPVVADDESYALNRLQLVNTSITNTTITLGRQRINIDDQRFVGNVGWRMNEQTFDALRVANKSVTNLTIDMTYSNRVNRVFGHSSPQGVYKGDVVLSNVSYQFKYGKLTGFGYLLDFDPILPPKLGAAANPARSNTKTFGLRFAGEVPLSKIKLGYAASYAMQDDYGTNPLVTAAAPNAMDNDYYLGEISATYKQFSLLAGYEILDGNGVAGFTTPLATLHKFQGWADKFLTTPANGLDDIYLTFGYNKKGLGPLDTFGVTAAYHKYTSERLTSKLKADELNLQVAAKYQRFNFMVKYADYMADTLFTDTKKLWVQVEYVW